MIKKMMFLLMLTNCGREERSQRPVEAKETDSLTENAIALKRKAEGYREVFQMSCLKNQNYRCLDILSKVNPIRIVSREGEVGRFTRFSDGTLEASIKDAVMSDLKLEHTVYHELGHALGFDHDHHNFLMRTNVTDQEVRRFKDEALEMLTL